MFQPLYRREASRTQPGYGLGLALVGAIAELHSAKVRTSSDKGGFCISVGFSLGDPRDLEAYKNCQCDAFAMILSGLFPKVRAK